MKIEEKCSKFCWSRSMRVGLIRSKNIDHKVVFLVKRSM